MQCNNNGDGTTTIAFTASGFAYGPYPGTFTEAGTAVIGPQTIEDPTPGRPNISEVISFSSEFQILSGTTEINGTKTLSPIASLSNTRGYCYRGEAYFFDNRINIDNVGFDALADYEAVISTPDGEFLDSGRSSVGARYWRQLQDRGGPVLSDYSTVAFGESYLLDATGVVPLGPGPAATLTLDPPAATNPVGTSHTVTATAADASGDAVDPTNILFTVRGSTTTSGQCTTVDGSCQFAYTGPQLPGADSITACADNNGSGTCDPGEPIAEATKAWLLPTSTAGQVTGGGQIPDPSDRNYKIAFGFNAQTKHDGSLKGNCSVVDQAPARNIHVKCVDVTALVQSGTHATFFGNATVNGVSTTYRIDVDDLGEPGKGHDTFKIQTASGYTTAGVLTQGNIQVHN